MCAINGINWKDEELVRKMNAATIHRGPDGSNTFSSEGVTLGQNRLAIIDLDSRSNQPMKSADGNLVITYNGELYNFKELKKELSDYPYRTESDTEVILAAYKKWGRDCVKKFDGIFAFAIWDSLKQELFLARDQMGVKPLYYYHKDGIFIFSSEIKGILAHNIPRKLNLPAFNHYMRLLYVPAPMTMFEGINKLPPAHTLTINKSGHTDISVYWEADKKRTNLSYEEARDEVKKSVLKSVSDQLVSDRPLGVYLSGGIDSSVIVAAMKKVRANIDTFSIGFKLGKEEQDEKFNADFNLARETAKHFGTNHHEILIDPSNIWETFEKAIWHMDEPVSNATIIPMYALSQSASKDVRVVLAGDGGDELFGGYPRYKKSRILDYLHLPISAHKRFERFMFQKNDVLIPLINPKYFEENSTRDFFKKNFPESSGNKTQQIMDLDRQSWLVDEALLRGDKMAMSNAVEARVPLLSTSIINLANNLPIGWKVAPFDTKKILKNAFRDELPANVLSAPKRGFFSPGAKWLRRADFLTKVRECLKPDYHRGTSELFNWAEVNNILDRHVAGEYYYNPIWAILTFQIWTKMFKIEL